jgi:hypothetical protein
MLHPEFTLELGLLDQDPFFICMDPELSININKKNNKKKFDFYSFRTLLYNLLSLKTDGINEQKNLRKNIFFVDILKATKAKSRIRIRKTAVWIPGSESVLKHHESGTLVVPICDKFLNGTNGS